MSGTVRTLGDAGRVRLVIAFGVACGLLFGLGVLTFVYARGASYLTDDSAACANCHVMREQYSGWIKASHRSSAICNDCHTPPGLIPKYYTKVLNGFFHSLAFTTGGFPEPIRITGRNRRVTEEACRHCHAPVVEAMVADPRGSGARGEVSCIRCHTSVGHLQMSSIGTAPP